ncbi:MAG: hypothetical protein ISS63_04100 [Desulfobacteraceae bacterium]|nr:hypothetical protein [Desulfobacteraceae bacterium]
MTKNNTYADQINCSTLEGVCEKIRKWNFNISKEHHLIRSAILSLHANIEGFLKQILFHHMLGLINPDFYEEDNELHIDRLSKSIDRMSFSHILKLLQPCLNAADSDTFNNLANINQIRNYATHKDIMKARYKGRNPFTDHDALAQLFIDVEHIHSELGEFYVQKIGLPADKVINRIKISGES